MLKVIDYNVLSTPIPMEQFFEDDPQNIGVITDAMGMECLKRENVNYFRSSFQHLQKYASRMVVLKNTATIKRIFPKLEGAREELIDGENTNTFPSYCELMLRDWHPNNASVIEQQQARAREFMGKLETAVGTNFPGAIAMMDGLRKERDVQLSKPGTPLSEGELDIATQASYFLAEGLFKETFKSSSVPHPKDLMSWMPARHAVATQALTIHWLRNRGYSNSPPATFRNDSMDLMYVSYGTYFEGVLSNDKRLQEVSRLTTEILIDGYGFVWVSGTQPQSV